MKIAGNDVTVITNKSAKVGCTTVTREEVEALLEEMKKLPPDPFYRVSLCTDMDGRISPSHVFVKMDTEETGFFSVSQTRNVDSDFYPCGSFANKTLWLCLRPDMARDLIVKLQQGIFQQGKQEKANGRTK